MEFGDLPLGSGLTAPLGANRKLGGPERLCNKLKVKPYEFRLDSNSSLDSSFESENFGMARVRV